MKATNLITAIVTPFDTQNHIDYAALEQLTEALLNHGSRGFVIGGTTGEGPTLTDTEKSRCTNISRHSLMVVCP